VDKTVLLLRHYMSIKTRFALLLGLLLLGFISSWFGLRKMEQSESQQILARAQEERAQMLRHWITFSARALPQFSAEYGQAEQLALSSSDSISPTQRAKIANALDNAGLQALLVLNAEGGRGLEIQAPGENTLSEGPPLPARETINALTEPASIAHFYARQDAKLWELCVRKINPVNGVPTGWLVVARRWDEKHLRALSNLMESDVSLVAPDQSISTSVRNAGSVVVVEPLLDERGNKIQALRAEYRDADLQRMVHADSRPVHVFIAFALLVIVALALALQMWVLRPLARITDSLARNDPLALGTLSQETTELGRVARLVEFSSAQTNALKHNEEVLRRTMDERARLGWDLHDGVIQSLYAAGMGLTGVRALLQPDQHMATGRLEQVRGILNETIRDIRNFITGLEPQALKQQSFAQAVTTLLTTMQAMRPLRTTVDIDDVFAARLSLAQRVHALQIVREAVSNALRHGEAGHVSVALRPQNEKAQFEISDDGRGFDPAVLSAGHGLGNLAERARELGAELDVQSAPGKGTRVKLIFSLRSH
jgi:signal transduction histidine kinase